MNNIKKIIKEKGWTLERLASEMNGGKGISQPSMSSIVNGNPTLSKLKEVASILDVPVSSLLADSSELTALVEYRGKFHRANTISELKAIIAEIESED